jgi:hypothetical protein
MMACGGNFPPPSTVDGERWLQRSSGQGAGLVVLQDQTVARGWLRGDSASSAAGEDNDGMIWLLQGCHWVNVL